MDIDMILVCSTMLLSAGVLLMFGYSNEILEFMTAIHNKFDKLWQAACSPKLDLDHKIETTSTLHNGGPYRSATLPTTKKVKQKKILNADTVLDYINAIPLDKWSIDVALIGITLESLDKVQIEYEKWDKNYKVRKVQLLGCSLLKLLDAEDSKKLQAVVETKLVPKIEKGLLEQHRRNKLKHICSALNLELPPEDITTK